MKKTKVGVVGCGNISTKYLTNMTQVFRNLEVVAVCDMLIERAVAKAEEFKVPHACPLAELLGNKDVEIVVNLTVPSAHAGVAMQALAAGKHVYTEKPMAITRHDGQEILKLAAEKNLRVGGAPDTFLGAGLQTCRKLIDDGWIGQPVAATAFMTSHGPEGWHPDPEFYYQVGGGPMFDMGPYYLTAMISLLGPVRKVAGMARATFPTRTITSAKKFGQVMEVEIPTHVAGTLEFASGAIGTMITTFDVWGSNLPRIEIYGTEGSLAVPDPNTFGGPIKIKRAGTKEWAELPLTHQYAENSRGLGVADMASAIHNRREHRANGKLTYHVLDLMLAFHDAASQGKHVEVQSTVDRPKALPGWLLAGMVD